MKPFWRYILSVSALLLVGCVPNQRALKEQRLLAAGFVQWPAVTWPQAQELASLPPHRIILQARRQKVTYIYADPVDCQCLYVGDRHAYGKFQYLTVLQYQADQAMTTAAMEQNAANLNFMAVTTPPPYWYPPYYPYYFYPALRPGYFYSPSPYFYYRSPYWYRRGYYKR